MAHALISSTEEEAFLDALSLAQALPKQAVTGLMKARAAHVAGVLSEKVAELGVDPFGVESGMSHSLPQVSWFTRTKAGDEEILAGWQYQEGVLRLALVLDHLSGTGQWAKSKRAEFARAHPEFFSFEHLDEILRTTGMAISSSSKPEGPFGHFDPDFMYRHKKVGALTVQQLIDLTVAQARHFERLSNALSVDEVS
ncbi:hypothetical protein [Arthrobacter sp. SO5]|uniref:hypothetical protein n=1 Tax=Arthrobacter sp. SO5 TaxID=1897055 RepID=UPI001E2A36C0|nr:hypothetical protein [Arthrobacter sp. SO5]